MGSDEKEHASPNMSALGYFGGTGRCRISHLLSAPLYPSRTLSGSQIRRSDWVLFFRSLGLSLWVCKHGPGLPNQYKVLHKSLQNLGGYGFYAYYVPLDVLNGPFVTRFGLMMRYECMRPEAFVGNKWRTDPPVDQYVDNSVDLLCSLKPEAWSLDSAGI